VTAHAKRTASAQLSLGLAVPVIQRCVSMARVEVFVPAEIMNLPECLVQAFEGRLHDLNAERVETVSIYGCDLARDLRREETTALELAKERYDVFYRIFRR
jgi:hypothetical protein